jgi:hypothetical protein
MINENNPNVTDDSFVYASDLYGTNDYVYILWGGQKLKDYKSNIVANSFVIVFNWAGDYIKTYQILNSTLIAINPSNSTLFASGLASDGTTEISTYDFKKDLDR